MRQRWARRWPGVGAPVDATVSGLDKFRILRRTIRNWPLVVPDKLGLVRRPRYRARGGEVFWCRPRSTDINEVVVLMSGHEYPEQHMRVRPGGVIIDLGAYIGDSVVYFDRVNRDVDYRGFAFEPAPANWELLKANVAANRVTAFELLPAAVSDVTGQVLVDTALRPDAVAVTRRPGRGTPVRSYRLSDFCRQRSIPRVDIVKMDIEGGEYAILRADHEFIRARVRRLVLEYHAGLEPIRDLLADDFDLLPVRGNGRSGVVVLENRH